MPKPYILLMPKYYAAMRLYIQDGQLRFRKNKAIPEAIRGALVPTLLAYRDVKKTIILRTSYAFNHVVRWMREGDATGREPGVHRNLYSNDHGRILEDISDIAPINMPEDELESLVRNHVEVLNDHIERDVYGGKTLLEREQRFMKQDYKLVKMTREQCMVETMRKVESALRKQYNIQLATLQIGQTVDAPNVQDALNYTALLFGVKPVDVQTAVQDTSLRKSKAAALVEKVDKRTPEYRTFRNIYDRFKHRELMYRTRLTNERANIIAARAAHVIVLTDTTRKEPREEDVPKFNMRINDLLVGVSRNEVPRTCPIFGIPLSYGIISEEMEFLGPLEYLDAAVECIRGPECREYTAETVAVISTLASILIRGPMQRIPRYNKAVKFVSGMPLLMTMWNQWLAKQPKDHSVYTPHLYDPATKTAEEPPQDIKKDAPAEAVETDVRPARVKIKVLEDDTPSNADELQEERA